MIPAGGVIALYPGSFKPPHAAHIAAVEYLLGMQHADHVVVIVSNRSRAIPGTGMALDAGATGRLLKLLLREGGVPEDKVSVEIAAHRAVDHALRYFDRVSPDKTLLFCVGQVDFDSGDDRYATVPALSEMTGIRARIEAIPAAGNPVRGATMRRALAAAGAGRQQYHDGLPDTLSAVAKDMIWHVARQSLEPVSAIVRRKIGAEIESRFGVDPAALDVEHDGTPDPEFVWIDKSGARCRAKYAGDTVAAESFEARGEAKPARRLAVEGRVIRHLSAAIDARFRLPSVMHFDKRLRLLVTKEPGGVTLDDALRARCYDAGTARAVGEFLGCLHAAPLPSAAFWGSVVEEERHWQEAIERYRLLVEQRIADHAATRNALRLLAGALAPKVRGIVHMSMTPRHLSMVAGRLGIREFERSVCGGDGAYDLGKLVAAYLRAAVSERPRRGPLIALRALLNAYRGGAPDVAEAERDPLMWCFAACALIDADEKDAENAVLATRLLRCGADRALASMCVGMTLHDDRGRLGADRPPGPTARG